MNAKLKDMQYIHVADGKYTVVLNNKQGTFRALRYGEEWRDCCGDNLIYWLAVELDDARKEIMELQEKCSENINEMGK